MVLKFLNNQASNGRVVAMCSPTKAAHLNAGLKFLQIQSLLNLTEELLLPTPHITKIYLFHPFSSYVIICSLRSAGNDLVRFEKCQVNILTSEHLPFSGNPHKIPIWHPTDQSSRSLTPGDLGPWHLEAIALQRPSPALPSRDLVMATKGRAVPGTKGKSRTGVLLYDLPRWDLR